MQLPAIPGLDGLTSKVAGLAGLAAFVRDRLSEVAPLWPRRDDTGVAIIGARRLGARAVDSSDADSSDADSSDTDSSDAGSSDPELSELESAGLVVVGAAGPFAPTSYARARLLRQLHASGLLTDRETEQAEQLFGVAQ